MGNTFKEKRNEFVSGLQLPPEMWEQIGDFINKEVQLKEQRKAIRKEIAEQRKLARKTKKDNKKKRKLSKPKLTKIEKFQRGVIYTGAIFIGATIGASYYLDKKYEVKEEKPPVPVKDENKKPEIGNIHNEEAKQVEVESYNIQDWYEDNNTNPEFTAVFGKYFTKSDEKLTIPELAECFSDDYFEGMTEAEKKKEMTRIVERGSETMENFTRDFVKYTVMKAVGDESLNINDFRTVYADNHTVGYKETRMVRTNDNRYCYENEELPEEICFLIKSNGIEQGGIVELAGINESKAKNDFYTIYPSGGYKKMKNTFDTAMKCAEKEYYISHNGCMEERPIINEIIQTARGEER